MVHLRRQKRRQKNYKCKKKRGPEIRPKDGTHKKAQKAGWWGIKKNKKIKKAKLAQPRKRVELFLIYFYILLKTIYF